MVYRALRAISDPNDSGLGSAQAGDIVLLNDGRPYTAEVEGDTEMLHLRVPQTLLRAIFPGADAATATPVDGLAGSAAMVRPLLHHIMNTADSTSPAAQQHLTTAVIELVAASLVQKTSLSTDAPMRAAHLARARDHIERHLGDPDLSPEVIARAVYISERHLHALFRDSGTSVTRYLMGRRLDRAHRELADPRQAHIPIADIASQVGFKCPKHFTKTFKAKFGLSPSEHRRDTCNAS